MMSFFEKKIITQTLKALFPRGMTQSQDRNPSLRRDWLSRRFASEEMRPLRLPSPESIVKSFIVLYSDYTGILDILPRDS